MPASIRAALPDLAFGEPIGRGGTGTVYAAWAGPDRRPLAIKVVFADESADPVRSARFAAEGPTLAGLDHPNIVAAVAHGRTADGFYLVMDRVDGPTLRTTLRDGPLPPWYAAQIAGQVCDALAYAHGRGVLHRDVKPENVLLDEDGTRVRMTDFGLATAAEPDDGPSLTGPRDVLGTRDYLAPECRRGMAAADERADVYAVGVVLYEMLVGRPPVGHFSRPGEVDPAAARFDAVVLRCLSDDPARRYPSAAAVRAALDRASRPGRRPAAIAAGVAAAIVGVAVTFALPHRPAAPTAAVALPVDPPAVPSVKELDLTAVGLDARRPTFRDLDPQWRGDARLSPP